MRHNQNSKTVVLVPHKKDISSKNVLFFKYQKASTRRLHQKSIPEGYFMPESQYKKATFPIFYQKNSFFESIKRKILYGNFHKFSHNFH